MNPNIRFSLIIALFIISNSACKKDKVILSRIPLPLIETIPLGKVGRIIKSGVHILSDSGHKIQAKGICWNTQPNPTVNDSLRIDTSSNKYFYVSMKYLMSNTTYYVRSWATNSGGTCYGKELSFTTESLQTLVVGDDYGGGKLAYIYGPGDPGYSKNKLHGIIAASTDLKEKAAWGCYLGQATGNGWHQTMDDYSIGRGKTNTSRLIELCGNKGAAYLCDELIQNGYDDWYFPSSFELSELFRNREAIGGFSDDIYWSSSWGYSESTPTYIYFFDGTGKFKGLSGLERVRPIRYF
jgi:hypothetical protein